MYREQRLKCDNDPYHVDSRYFKPDARVVIRAHRNNTKWREAVFRALVFPSVNHPSVVKIERGKENVYSVDLTKTEKGKHWVEN